MKAKWPAINLFYFLKITWTQCKMNSFDCVVYNKHPFSSSYSTAKMNKS